MGTPVGQRSATIIGALPPALRIRDVRGVVDLACGSEPQVPVQVVGNRCRLFVVKERLHGKAAGYGMHFAKGAGSGQSGQHVVLDQAAIFDAPLKDLVGPGCRFRQLAALCDGQTGLLTEGVFAGLERHQRHGHVPVVRSGDDDDIQVVPRQNFTEVLVHSAVRVAILGVNLGLCGRGLAEIAVADREGAEIGGVEETREIPANALVSHANESCRELF